MQCGARARGAGRATLVLVVGTLLVAEDHDVELRERVGAAPQIGLGERRPDRRCVEVLPRPRLVEMHVATRVRSFHEFERIDPHRVQRAVGHVFRERDRDVRHVPFESVLRKAEGGGENVLAALRRDLEGEEAAPLAMLDDDGDENTEGHVLEDDAAAAVRERACDRGHRLRAARRALHAIDERNRKRR
jgi:hypothetical protein